VGYGAVKFGRNMASASKESATVICETANLGRKFLRSLSMDLKYIESHFSEHQS
jgi:hypothetical protein